MEPRTIATDVLLPPIGFGLWKNTDEAECKQSIWAAIDAGYRLFDTAQAYGNEQYVGAALRESGLQRNEYFITTKIAVQNFGAKRAAMSVDRSLEDLGVDYVDLLLLHFPVPLLRGRTWKVAEEAVAAGKTRSVGVSNYTIRHLKQLLAECSVKPAVNQVELHVFLQQPELLAYCAEQGIAVEAYSPLAHGKGLQDPVLASIAQKHGKTPTQIMLRWCVEVGTVPLPKSTHAERIADNIAIFDFSLDTEDMDALRGLEQGLRTCWDPTPIP